jgi:DNA-binding response OmpR family regulator
MIEDSERLRRSVGSGLRKVGYAVDATGSGAEGLWLAEANPYDVIILDLMLPGIDGLTILKKLRASTKPGAHSHVLILTAKDTIADRVTGLRGGADDYLIKPFSFDELLARIEALIRRHHEIKNPFISVGNLVIDTIARTVKRNGVLIDLTARQYALLHFLVVRQGMLVSRTDIESSLYDEHTEPMSNVIDAAVYALRKRIDVPGEPSMIQTRRGMGYILQPPPSAASIPESKTP